VTAHDIKFTTDLLSHPDILVYNSRYDCKVIDDFTFTINSRRGGWGHGSSWGVYLPKHLLENLDKKDWKRWEFWKQPVGNGPFRYVRHVPKTMIELEANPDYFQGKPKIDKIILKFGGVAMTELLSGNVDIIGGLAGKTDLLKASMLAEDSRFNTYHTVPEPGTNAVFWNQKTPFFHDIRVRKALVLAVNRRELFRVLNIPDEVEIRDGPVYQFEERLAFPYDPDLAKTLLQEAGWTDENSDGVRERNNRKFHFTLITSSNSGRGTASVYLQEQLSRVGIRMEIQILARGVLRERLKFGDFDAVFENGNVRRLLAGPDNKSPIGYENQDYVQFMKEFVTDMDPGKGIRYQRKLWEINQRDIPVLTLHPNIKAIILHRRIRGLSSPIMGLSVIERLKDLWIEEEK